MSLHQRRNQILPEELFREKKEKQSLKEGPFTCLKCPRIDVLFTTIAHRFKLYSGQLDDEDMTSATKTIEANVQSDGFKVFVPAHALSGDELMMVIVNLIQVKWLCDYSSRGISIEDTFNIT
ncbi:hypothetical protein Aduo_012878 [Ancylostoma duodenale]